MNTSASLWRHRDFRQLWTAESISQVGTQITLLAMPVMAVTLLHATPFEMGVLTALETVAFLLIGLPAGAWVDRWRRKRVLVVNDLIRFVALSSLPVAWALDVLSLPLLFVVAVNVPPSVSDPLAREAVTTTPAKLTAPPPAFRN